MGWVCLQVFVFTIIECVYRERDWLITVFAHVELMYVFLSTTQEYSDVLCTLASFSYISLLFGWNLLLWQIQATGWVQLYVATYFWVSCLQIKLTYFGHIIPVSSLENNLVIHSGKNFGILITYVSIFLFLCK